MPPTKFNTKHVSFKSIMPLFFGTQHIDWIRLANCCFWGHFIEAILQKKNLLDIVKKLPLTSSIREEDNNLFFSDQHIGKLFRYDFKTFLS